MQKNTSYPNQLRAKICKQKGERFLMISISDIRQAAEDLSHAALKLFLYLAENQDGYSFNLSPKDFMQIYKVSESTYRRAKEELLKKGYLIQDGKEITFFSKKQDKEKSYEYYKEKMKKVKDNLIVEGYEIDKIKEILQRYGNLKEMQGKAQINAAKNVLEDLQNVLRELSEKDELI